MSDKADPIAVERLVAGDPPARVHPAELHLAIVELGGRGMSADGIATRVGCSSRQVVRARRLEKERAASSPSPIAN
jgi:hypothetical protein